MRIAALVKKGSAISGLTRGIRPGSHLTAGRCAAHCHIMFGAALMSGSMTG